jgi:hypothetical protein
MFSIDVAVLRIVWLECFSNQISSTPLSDRPVIEAAVEK